MLFYRMLFYCSSVNAQNWDINLLRSINPQNPNSFVWKGFTSSAYPLSVAVPVGIWVDWKN